MIADVYYSKKAARRLENKAKEIGIPCGNGEYTFPFGHPLSFTTTFWIRKRYMRFRGDWKREELEKIVNYIKQFGRAHIDYS